MASLEEDFRAFANAPTSVVDGALLVSRIVHADTSEAWCRGELRGLSREVGEARKAASVLAMLRKAGFQGAEQYYDPDNSALELVLRRKGTSASWPPACPRSRRCARRAPPTSYCGC